MQTVFNLIVGFFAIVGYVYASREWFIMKVISFILFFSSFIFIIASVMNGNYTAWYVVIIFWFSISVIYSIMDFKGWSTPTVDVLEDGLKNELEDERLKMMLSNPEAWMKEVNKMLGTNWDINTKF